MKRVIITLSVLILGLSYAVQDKETTQVLNPQLSGAELSIPKSINFQGYLYRDGNPMDTTMNMWFGIYTALSGGSLLFQQTVNNVEVINGWFTVTLDNIPNSVFPVSGPTRYLEVKAPSTGPALEPRISLVSVGYSYHSITSDTAEYAITGIPTGSAGGDLAGTYPNPTVDGLRGRTVASTAPSTNQVLKWTGSLWAPGNDSVGSGGSGTVTSVSQSTGITCTPNPITNTGTVALNTGYTDGRYVNTTGDSMTGDLAMSSNLRVYNKAFIGANCSNSGSNAFAVGNGSAVSGNRSSILGGYQNTIDGNDATIAGGAYNYAGTHVCFVGAGQRDTAYGRFCGVLSGYGNVAGNAATDTASVIAGGYLNKTTTPYSFIGGGQENTISNYYATIGGGISNSVTGYGAAIGGGYDNQSVAVYGGVLSGYSNIGGNGSSDTGATVAGGYDNSATGKSSFVGGGYQNTASNYYSTVSGGRDNNASGSYTTVGGGNSNTASLGYATIGGGRENTTNGDYATIAGGWGNSAYYYSTVAGGYFNEASDQFAVVTGGAVNKATGTYSTVNGGSYNLADGNYSVAGGRQDTALSNNGAVLSGRRNRAGMFTSESCAVVVGGCNNYAVYDYCTIGGGGNNYAGGTAATVMGGLDCYASGNYATAVGHADTARGGSSFAAGTRSVVPSGIGYAYSAAFNSQTATGGSQLRCDDLYANSMIFGMDHPLDLENKILNQFAVASPEILVTFRGSCIIGSDGRVQVNLSDYFDALCRNPMVQLTGVGTPEVIYVAKDVLGNQFTIGGPAGTKVYWIVTGERKDQLAEVTRTLTPVEKTRTDELIGRSINEASLANKMAVLEQRGLDSKFNFRTAAGKSRYESSRKLLEAKP